jgi:hypothetical protein
MPLFLLVEYVTKPNLIGQNILDFFSRCQYLMELGKLFLWISLKDYKNLEGWMLF